jgi:uncharacterized protein
MNENMQPVSKFIKFLQFPLVRILLGLFFIVFVFAILQFGTEKTIGSETGWANLISGIITTSAVLFAYYWFVLLVEKRTVAELSLPSTGKELISGVLIGTILFSLTIGVLWIFGYYQVTGTNEWTVVFS